MTNLQAENERLRREVAALREQVEPLALERLRQSEASLAEAQAIAHVGSWSWNLATDTSTWSDEMFRIFGMEPRAEVPAVSRTMEWILPEDRARVDAALEAAMQHGGHYHVDYRIQRPDGSVRALDVRGVVTFEAGRPTRMIGTVQDITEQWQTAQELKRQKEDVEAEVVRRTEALRQSEARLAEAQELTRTGNWEWDVLTDRVAWSDEQYRLFGYFPQECQPTYAMILSRVHPDDRARHDAIVKAALLDGRPYAFDHRVVHPDGTTLVLHSVGRGVTDEQGRITRLMGTSQDVTEQRRLEAERTRFVAELQRQTDLIRQIVDHTPAGIAYLDRDLIYRWANPTHLQLIGLPKEQVLNRGLFEVFGPGSEEQLGPAVKGVRDTGQPYYAVGFPFEYEVDGIKRMTYWDYTNQPIFDESGQVQGILLLGLEVTERVEKEHLQRQHTETLEQTNRMKDEFLSVISHELRTPLNFIMGFASILDDEVAGPLNVLQHEYLSKLLKGADRMLVLVNNLLDMSRMAAGKFHLSPALTDYRGVVLESVGALEPLAAEKHVALETELDVPGEVYLDGARLVQVLTNLVDNAIKFSPESGRIRIRAFRRDGELVTEVADMGAGIAPADLPKLFQPFGQLDMSATRKVGGTGLGLTICKTIVEAHGGQIGVRSVPGLGSTFWFVLPLVSPPQDEHRE